MTAIAHSQVKAKRSRTTDYWVLFATIAAASMAYVASNALSVALPSIQRELNTRGADLIWIVNSYVIVQASVLIVCGSVSDRYGRNRVCSVGIVLFGIASLISGSASSAEMLILGRFAQGFGSAMLVVSSLAIVSSYFSDNRHGWAIGMWSAFTILTSGLSPFVGGILAELGLWRWAFYIPIPFGIIAVWILWRYVPETYDKTTPKKIRVSGSILVILGLLGITYGFVEAPQLGIDHPSIMFAIVFGILALVIFVWGEQRTKFSIMPLDLFKSRTFSGANLTNTLVYVSLGPSILYIPLYMIQVQGYSEIFVGLGIVPMTLLMLVISAFIGGMVDKHGPRKPIVAGSIVSGLGYFLLTTVGITGGQETYFTTFFLPICLIGIGLGLILAPVTTAVMGSVEQSKAGIASGINNTLTRVGQVLSVAILGGLVLSTFTQALLSSPTVQALPEDAREFLAMGSVDLAETSMPSGLTQQQQQGVHQAIDESFVAAFNFLMWIATAGCLINAAISWFTIDNRLLIREEDLA